MSYLVLARKYRSKTFDDLIGQEHIARTLTRAIESERIAHAYLFCGTRGTGKTSTARILAKCLNCEKSKGPTAKPCGECNSCTAIARGEDIDVIEIDAASNTGVDNVRDLIANSQFHPARSRFKVYIIDEVHMLSKQAFNALLKTLEEPPAHVKFLLATTEPEKVLPTILSRCQRYDFRNIPTREIAEHLKSICKQEKIKADEDALLLVAKAGAGSMRDSLSLLDRLLSIGEKELTVEMIEQMLGLPKSQLVFDLAQALGEADVKQTLSRADAMITGGLAPDTLIASLVDHLRNLLILRTCGPDSNLVEVPGLSPKDLATQASHFDPIVLSQDIAVLEELRRSLRTSQAGRALLDATLVRLALAEQFNDIGELLSGSVDGAAGAGQKKKSDELTPSPRYSGERAGERGEVREKTSHGTPAAPASSGESNDDRHGTPPAPLPNPLPGYGEREPEPAASAATVDDDDDALPAVGKVWDASGPSLSELLKQRRQSTPATVEPQATPQPAAPQAEASNVSAVNVSDLPAVWQKLLDALAERGPMFQSLLINGRLTGIADGQATIRYDKRHETFVKMLERNGKKDAVRDALTQVTGEAVGVRFEIDEAGDAIREEASGGGTATQVQAAPRTALPRPPMRREPVRLESPPTPQPQPAPTLKITPELIESLRTSEPLIKGLIDDLGATIVKVEPPEAASDK